MDAFILVCEELAELFLVDLVKMAEPLTDVAVEGQVGAVLRATLDHHVAKFDLLARPNLQLEQLVAALFKLDG